jgi:transcriptional regulator with XRE-family HTH domain
MTTQALYRELGQRLRAVRRERGYTQDQVATAVSLERTSITNIESGRQRLPIHTLYEYCDALGVEVAEVLPPTSLLARERKPLALNVGDESVLVPASVAQTIDRLFTEKT